MTVFKKYIREFHELKAIIEDKIGPRSELSKGSFEVGRKLAHLPD